MDWMYVKEILAWVSFQTIFRKESNTGYELCLFHDLHIIERNWTRPTSCVKKIIFPSVYNTWSKFLFWLCLLNGLCILMELNTPYKLTGSVFGQIFRKESNTGYELCLFHDLHITERNWTRPTSCVKKIIFPSVYNIWSKFLFWLCLLNGLCILKELNTPYKLTGSVFGQIFRKESNTGYELCKKDSFF